MASRITQQDRGAASSTGGVRYHPYSQNTIYASRVRRADENVIGNTTRAKPVIVPPKNKGLAEITNTLTEYDKQYYVNAAMKAQELKSPGKQSRTQPARKVTKNEAQNQLEVKLAQINGEARHLKIFSCSLDNIQLIESKLIEIAHQQQLNNNSNSKKSPTVGEHMYEFIAQLDSAVTEGNLEGEKMFIAKGRAIRVNCIYNEIDLKMDKIARNSWIRCVGKYDTKKTSFVCMKVRTASNPELFKFGSLIEHTSEYLRVNYL